MKNQKDRIIKQIRTHREVLGMSQEELRDKILAHTNLESLRELSLDHWRLVLKSLEAKVNRLGLTKAVEEKKSQMPGTSLKQQGGDSTESNIEQQQHNNNDTTNNSTPTITATTSFDEGELQPLSCQGAGEIGTTEVSSPECTDLRAAEEGTRFLDEAADRFNKLLKLSRVPKNIVVFLYCELFNLFTDVDSQAIAESIANFEEENNVEVSKEYLYSVYRYFLRFDAAFTEEEDTENSQLLQTLFNNILAARDARKKPTISDELQLSVEDANPDYLVHFARYNLAFLDNFESLKQRWYVESRLFMEASDVELAEWAITAATPRIQLLLESKYDILHRTE